MPNDTGAPAQHTQGSRKGKRAWRKNVDIGEIESGLEVLRQEERVTGGHVHSKTNEQLFAVDTHGDDNIRKKLPKVDLKSLTSYKILSQRSAVPAVGSNKKSSVPYEEKKRMFKAGRRLKGGLLDVSAIPAKLNEVSVGHRDMWGNTQDDPQGSGVKMPTTVHPHRKVALPHVPLPHPGTSYNPTVDSHQELLLKAHQVLERREAEVAKYDGVKEAMHQRRKETYEEGLAPGMDLDAIEDVVGEEQAAEGERLEAKPSKPKTKKQRRTAAVLLQERKQRAAKAARKKQLEAITRANLKSLKQSLSHADEVAAAKARKEDELKMGLAGKKLGKHVVPEERIDVQLGEELSESFRALQPEGSILRDRFDSLQQRALIEPRVRVVPRRRRLRIKDYEKHAWKRFK